MLELGALFSFSGCRHPCPTTKVVCCYFIIPHPWEQDINRVGRRPVLLCVRTTGEKKTLAGWAALQTSLLQTGEGNPGDWAWCACNFLTMLVPRVAGGDQRVLDGGGIDGIHSPTCSPHINPIQHLWDALYCPSSHVPPRDPPGEHPSSHQEEVQMAQGASYYWATWPGLQASGACEVQPGAQRSHVVVEFGGHLFCPRCTAVNHKNALQSDLQ